MKKLIAASMMCADLLDLRRGVRELEKAGVDYLHCDVMDGDFVPNWMMFPDLVNALGRESHLPLDIHLMVREPLRMLPSLSLRPGDIVTLSCESTAHIQRGLAAVRERGGRPAVALNPGTPLCMLEDLLPDLEMLLLMTVNPGYAGQKLVPQTLDKIARARGMLDAAGYAHIPIEVDGNCSFDNVPRMVQRGADMVVAGTSSIFMEGLSLVEGVRMLREAMEQGRGDRGE